MDVACAPDIEQAMDLLNEAGIVKVVRVIAHPRQDIGLSIMSLFHYRRWHLNRDLSDHGRRPRGSGGLVARRLTRVFQFARAK